jgi:hypothetical protein
MSFSPGEKARRFDRRICSVLPVKKDGNQIEEVT